jgi:excisionase family DNA binding protein
MRTYLTTEKLAEFLNISVQTLNKWRWEGKGPRFVKLGSRVVYDQADVEAYMAQQVRRSTTDRGETVHAT